MYIFLHLHKIVEGLYFHCSLCVCEWVSLSVSEQNSSPTEPPIWTRFSLNGCLAHWLGPYWNWWPWVKGQGHNDVISIFFCIQLSIYRILLNQQTSYLVPINNYIRYIYWLKWKWPWCRKLQVKVKGHKNEIMVIACKLFYSQTSYLIPRYNTISNI